MHKWVQKLVACWLEGKHQNLGLNVGNPPEADPRILKQLRCIDKDILRQFSLEQSGLYGPLASHAPWKTFRNKLCAARPIPCSAPTLLLPQPLMAPSLRLMCCGHCPAPNMVRLGAGGGVAS